MIEMLWYLEEITYELNQNNNKHEYLKKVSRRKKLFIWFYKNLKLTGEHLIENFNTIFFKNIISNLYNNNQTEMQKPEKQELLIEYINILKQYDIFLWMNFSSNI